MQVRGHADGFHRQVAGYSYEDYRELRLKGNDNSSGSTSNGQISKNRASASLKQKKISEKSAQKSSPRKKNLKNSGVKSKNKQHGTSQNTGTVRKYRVRKGDTLYSIAKKHGVSLSELCRKNSIKNKTRIIPGMTLAIPGKSSGLSSPGEKTDFNKQKGAPVFVWPVKNVASCKRDGNNGVRSIGIFIVGKGDSRVYTSANGVVKKIGEMRGFGKYVVVKHNEKFITVYSNLDAIAVKQGDFLEKGELIGRLTQGERLHFQIDYSGKPQNPLIYLPKQG
ncbi:MAG TPA: peptidoglycan DD-metalloendopeptidase family protein [Spirochaetota bacterium]|nr:peptidoglycan DD-metalloendopeptidase family protein [Spirochaetota bacterium]HPI87802.1 peptidoglycan DD-metalloendopeptidase family protein [Spirochaetota bacterium]HPR47022.1 peptidoglycan DD-metalloendopeptidase family protein [Spirochaetota bacterium]